MHAEMSEIAVINDNNNFALSVFNNCVISLGVVLVPQHFLCLGLQQWPWFLHNDLQRDGVQFLLSKYLCIKEF